MLIQFGNFQFSISTAAYDRLTRYSRANWVRLPILGGGEVLQALGHENDIIELVGTFYPEFASYMGGKAGTFYMDGLRNYLKSQEPRRIVTERGSTLGYWVIEDFVNQDSRFMIDGTPRKQSFRLRMRYYGKLYP